MSIVNTETWIAMVQTPKKTIAATACFTNCNRIYFIGGFIQTGHPRYAYIQINKVLAPNSSRQQGELNLIVNSYPSNSRLSAV